LNKSELNELTNFACNLALGAGDILHRGLNHARKIVLKGRIDPVTEYDLKSETYITSRILKRYPHHCLLTEEGSAVGKVSEYRWVIDPLDGTVNFAHGFPVYCVSIALEYQGEVIVGAVYDPERKELFWSRKGGKPYLNKKAIGVSSERNLERALLATGFAYDIGTARRNNLGLFARMAKRAQGIRRPGSAAIDLCWLACGRIDGFWELKLHPWDTAAAVLFVKNAGGKVSRIDGRPYSIFDSDLLASNGHLHRAMKAVLCPVRQ
jgi:myo-inositol-1(or 4)-monophosphatase